MTAPERCPWRCAHHSWGGLPVNDHWGRAVNWAEAMMQKGRTPEQIATRLAEAGWTSEDIAALQGRLAGTATASGPLHSDDPFVRACFSVEGADVRDPRNWRDMPEARAVVEAGNSGQNAKALALAGALVDQCPDFAFAHSWQALLLRRLGRVGEARDALVRGLPTVRKKSSLCTEMGELEWEARNGAEAVRWWIGSILLQLTAGNVSDFTPFLWLSYVAESLTMEAATTALRRWVDKINPTWPRFTAQKANEISVLVRVGSDRSRARAAVAPPGEVHTSVLGAEKEAVMRALEILTSDYLS